MKKKIIFAASSGGHLEQILCLKDLRNQYYTILVTEKTKYDVNSWHDRVYKIPQVNRREIFAIIKLGIISLISIFILIKEKPDVVISTGALAVVPLCLFSKIFRKKLIYIESFAKVQSATMTGKLMYKFANLFIVQWDDLNMIFPDAVYGGAIY